MGLTYVNVVVDWIGRFFTVHRHTPPIKESKALKQKEKWANEYIFSLRNTQRRPGISDIWVEGFEFCKRKIIEECRKQNESYIYVDDLKTLGEKEIIK